MRVFVGPFEIAGYNGRLAEALRGIGVDAVAVDLSEHRFGYAREKPASIWVRAAVWAERRWIGSRGRPALLRLPLAGMRVTTRLGLTAWSITRFDAFIFGYGTTLLFTCELPFLRLLGKRLVFTLHGSDARPPYIDGSDMAPSRGTTVDECIAIARRRKALIRRIECFADAVVSLPTFSHFFERPVVDYLRVGAPWTAPQSVGRPGSARDEIRVLHSPSDPEVKGSDRIRATVAAVRADGRPVRLIELREVGNDVVRAEIARADFVIDQLYSDTPMAVFVTEAAAAGVPAIVGSYAWPELRRLYGDRALPPVHQCHPDGLRAAMERLADDREYRLALGSRARAYVQDKWAPGNIAARYLAVLRGHTPDGWLFDPADIRYLHGAGLPEARTREVIAAVIARGGREGLALADKPWLDRAFVRFATPDHAQ